MSQNADHYIDISMNFFKVIILLILCAGHLSFSNDEWTAMIPDTCWESTQRNGYVLYRDTDRYRNLFEKNEKDFRHNPPNREWSWNWGRIQTQIINGIDSSTECQKEVFVAARNDLYQFWFDRKKVNCTANDNETFRRMIKTNSKDVVYNNLSVNCKMTLMKIDSIEIMNKYYQDQKLEKYKCERINGTGVLKKTYPIAEVVDVLVDVDKIKTKDLAPPKPKPNQCWDEMDCEDKILMSSIVGAIANAENDKERLRIYSQGLKLLEDNGRSNTAAKIKRYLNAKSAEITSKQNLQKNKKKILSALNSNPYLKTGFIDLGIKMKEIIGVIEDLKGSLSGAGLLTEAMMSIHRNLPFSSSLPTRYEKKLQLYTKLTDELKSIKIKLEGEYKNYINSDQVDLSDEEINISIKNFGNFLNNYTSPLLKSIEDHYDEAAGTQGALGKVADSLIAADIALLGAVIPIPKVKDAVLACGVNLLFTQSKDIHNIIIDAFGTNSGSFWCSFTQKGLDEINAGKGRIDSDKAFDCGIGAGLGLVLPPMLAVEGKLATTAIRNINSSIVIAGGVMNAYGVGSELIAAGENYMSGMEEGEKGNEELKRCYGDETIKNVHNIISDISMIVAE